MKNNILNTIFSKLKKISFTGWIIIILSLLTIFFYFRYKHYYNKSLTPVVIYKTDSLDVYKNKIKELYKEREIYVQTVKDLSKQNNWLSVEYNKLKDNPIVITKTDLQIQIDTIKMKSDTIVKTITQKDTVYNLSWSSSDNKYYNINGVTNVKYDFTSFNTQINNLSLSTGLYLNIIEENKKIKLIGKTDNPYINIINMDGVILDPSKNPVLRKYYKQKRFSIGPTIGYGLTSDMKFRPYIGIGINYGIIQF